MNVAVLPVHFIGGLLSPQRHHIVIDVGPVAVHLIAAQRQGVPVTAAQIIDQAVQRLAEPAIVPQTLYAIVNHYASSSRA